MPGFPKTTIQQQAVDRVFEVNTGGLTVNFSNLTIAGGTAVDDTTPGALPGTTTAEGGGLWASGDTLVLSIVTFRGDQALGGPGTVDSIDGQIAEGGAIWDSGGTLGMTNATFQGNSAVGGAGLAGTSTSPDGGTGGEALGGGLFATSGVAVTLGRASLVSLANFNGNQADGGAGGAGFSTTVDTPVTAGGNGGFGGGAFGGAVYADAGATISDFHASWLISLNPANFSGNKALGGNGASGGDGTSAGGNGGTGGPASGGGLYADTRHDRAPGRQPQFQSRPKRRGRHGRLRR